LSCRFIPQFEISGRAYCPGAKPLSVNRLGVGANEHATQRYVAFSYSEGGTICDNNKMTRLVSTRE
jgi:hypothetical protein